MPPTFKRNALFVFGLAGVFCWAFMLAKHDPSLRKIIPFGEDPYDAVGSFASIIGVLVAVISLVRAFRPYREYPSSAQRVYLVRSQEAVVLAVLITLAADAIAMARHPTMWLGTASRGRLLALLGGLAIVTAFVQWAVSTSRRELKETRSAPCRKTVLVPLLAIFVLSIYPERLINGIITHLLTITVGDLILFAPMWALLTALVPYKDERRAEKPIHSVFSSALRRWGIVTMVGFLVGALAFFGEMSEGTCGMPVFRLAFVACVFVALGLTGLLIAYAFLGRPLGLAPQRPDD